MRKFVKKIMWFLFFPMIYFIIIGWINYINYSQFTPEIKSKIIIVGDSHLQMALNPKIIHNSSNICLSAETYIISYWKLKKILKKNKPRKVLIGFAQHNLSAFNDLKFFNEGISTQFFIRYYPILDFQKSNSFKIDYKEYYHILWKETCFYPKTTHGNYLGYYITSKQSKVNDSEVVATRHYGPIDNHFGSSKICRIYLDSILWICKKHAITPILIGTPVHNSYYTKIPTSHQKFFEKTKKELRKKGILIIDKTHEQYPDSLFFQTDHLNEKGSRRFSIEINRILKN